ncbi:unnamed protein product [Ascophyllum nodosum]
MRMNRVFGSLVSMGDCITRASGFAAVQLRGRGSANRRIPRTSSVAAASTLSSPNLAHFPRVASAGAGRVLALALLSSSSRIFGEAAALAGWTSHGRSSRTLCFRHPPSMAVASVAQPGTGGGASIQKGTPSSRVPTEAKVPVIFVLGGPGSGKGTQCELLAKECGYVHLSAGELLRQERESGSSDGQLIDEFIREGRIVPVAITIDLLKKAMQASGPAARFLIDGFPRNSDNREGWESVMADVAEVRCVLFFYCPEDVLEQRLLSRGRSSGRTDDNAKSAKKRFRTYVETTLPIVEKYEREGIVTRVNGNQDIQAVFRDVLMGLRPVQEQEVLDAHRAAAAAASSGDWAAYAEMCASDVTELFGGETSDAARIAAAAPPSCSRARILNGGAGVVWCERALAGEGGAVLLQETTVWEMDGGRWKCVHRHASPRSS